MVERVIGIWKMRFPVLAYGTRIRKMDTIMTVIVATAVLHNIARQMNEPEPPEPDVDLGPLIEMGQIANNFNQAQENITAETIRDGIINNYFANL